MKNIDGNREIGLEKIDGNFEKGLEKIDGNYKNGLEKIGEIKDKCVVDEDLGEIEKGEYSVEERGKFIGDIVEGLFNETSWISREAYKSGEWGVRKANGRDDGVKHFLLPGMLGGDKLVDGVRENYEECSGYMREYKKSAERVLAIVRQGRMWEVDNANKPYLMVHISECSVIVATKKDKSLMAHISMSYVDQTRGVMEYLQNNGYDLKDVWVVASVGDRQKEKSGKYGDVERFHDAEDYLKLGIKQENLICFEYDRTDDGKDVNMSTVIAGGGIMYKYSYDMQPRKTMFGEVVERVGEEKECKIIDIK